jgi:hypothetical protein
MIKIDLIWKIVVLTIEKNQVKAYKNVDSLNCENSVAKAYFD